MLPAELNTKFWRINLIISAVAGWLSLAWLLSAPSEQVNALLMGFSAERLALAAPLLTAALLFSRWFLVFQQSTKRSKQIQKRFTKFVASKLFPVIAGVATASLVLAWIALFVPVARAATILGGAALYLERLRPLSFFAVVLALLWIPLALAIRFGFDAKVLRSERATFRLGAVIFAALALAGVLIAVTGLGLGFDASVWNAPGTPLLSGQVLTSLLAASAVLALVYPALNRWQPNWSKDMRAQVRLDIGLTLVVWLLAAVLWLAQPAEQTYYNTSPLPPAGQSYPLSDAFNHDVIANNVLLGEGFHFGDQVATRRPFYVLFLAGLESLFGADYAAVETAQVVVLALFPALLYLLGTRLHSRIAGLLIAGLVIFREANSIALGHVINASHAKLLMADLPTALMMVALALGAVAWLRKPADNWLAPILVGGLLGSSILLRSQSLTLVPFFLLLALLVWGWRKAWKQALLFILGVLLVAAPWVVRNRIQMGQWAIEDAVVSGFLANRYSFTPGTYGLPFLAGEGEGEYYARQMTSVREFTLENPVYVASFVADNYVRNQLLNFLALPLSFELRDAENHVRELPYWPGWEGDLPIESVLPLLAGLFFVGLGLAAAWKNAGWVGLVPVFINLGFTVNLALARVSGWRYNLPVDWTVLFYFALGIAQVVLWAMQALPRARNAREFVAPQAQKTSKRVVSPTWGVAAGVILLVLLGFSFNLIETFTHPRFKQLSPVEVNAAIAPAQLGEGTTEADKDAVLAFLSGGRVGALNGRALHPRFYAQGDGIAGRDFVLTDVMDFSRVTFYLIGPEPASVILRTNQSQLELPASADVIVLYCGASEALAVLVLPANGQPILHVTEDTTAACP